jgi:hypothetical protein
MRSYILFSFLTLIPILWIINIFILKNWKHVIKYTVINIVFILTYFTNIFYCLSDHFINDQYGIEKVFYFILLLITHTLIAFIFALYFKFKLSQNVN